MRKILYSPGYGAGWSSWNSGDVAKYMLEYQPIISFLEDGGSMSSKKGQQLLMNLQDECKEKFNESYVCVIGADQLKVAEVFGRVRINEYDGYESIEEEGSFNGWV